MAAKNDDLTVQTLRGESTPAAGPGGWDLACPTSISIGSVYIREMTIDTTQLRRPALTVVWQLVVAATATLYTALIPLDLAFDLDAGFPFARFADLIVSLIFAADVVFVVASHRKRGLVDRRWERWILPADVIAALPLRAVFNVPALGLFSLLKMLRVATYLHEWRQRAIRVSTRLLLVYAFYWLSLCGHWIACGWLSLRESASASDPVAAYVDAVYWTITTITAVGYGDIVPATVGQKLYAAGTMLVGLSFLGYIIGVVAGTLSKRDSATARYTEAIDELNQAARYWQLPKHLERRIHDYHFYVWQKRLGYNEADFLKTLPRNLKAEVALFVKSEVLDRVEIFHDAEPRFLEDVALRLRPEVLGPGERVVEQGEPGEDMYFIVRGELEVIDGDGKAFATLTEGDFFGEIALFTDEPRTATVRTLTYCDVYVLTRSSFRYLSQRYPAVHERIKAAALARASRRHV